MKSLVQYIFESFPPNIEKWLKSVYENMTKLIKDNKVEPIDIDVKKLSKPDKGAFKYQDYKDSKVFKDIINNKQLGFAVTNQILQAPNKYLVDKSGEEQYIAEPECLPYWYAPTKDDIYFVGIVLFDTNKEYIENFATVDNIETSLCVKESLPVLKAILNDFALHYVSKKKNYAGLCAKPIHPKTKAMLVRLGFSQFKDNKEIYTYKL